MFFSKLVIDKDAFTSVIVYEIGKFSNPVMVLTSDEAQDLVDSLSAELNYTSHLECKGGKKKAVLNSRSY